MHFILLFCRLLLAGINVQSQDGQQQKVYCSIFNSQIAIFWFCGGGDLSCGWEVVLFALISIKSGLTGT